MQYNDELRGCLFNNTYKNAQDPNDRSPHFKGRCVINGKEWAVAAWWSWPQKGGDPYLQLKFEPPRQAQPQAQGQPYQMPPQMQAPAQPYQAQQQAQQPMQTWAQPQAQPMPQPQAQPMPQPQPMPQAQPQPAAQAQGQPQTQAGAIPSSYGDLPF